MENNFDDLLAQKFRDSLENYPVAYEPGAWQEFEQNYLQKKPARIVSLWQTYTLRIAAALLIAVIGLGSLYYRYNTATSAAGENTALHTPKSADQSSAGTDIPTPSANTDAANNSSEAQNSYPPQMPRASKSVAKTPLPRYVKVSPITENVNNSRRELIPASALAANIATPTENNRATAQTTLDALPLLPLTLADSLIWQFPSLETTQAITYNIVEPQYASVLKVLPGMQLLSGVAGGTGVETPAAFYGAGAGVDLFLQKKLALTTGIQLTQTNYETPEQSFRVFSNLKMDSASAAMGAAQFVPVFADEKQYSRVRLNLIQVPVTVKYLIGKKFFVNAGAVSYIATNNTQVAQVAQHSFLGRVQNTTQPIENSIQPFRTLYLGGGMRVPLKKATLQVEPHVSLPLGDILQDVNNTSLQWIGLNVGIYYGQ